MQITRNDLETVRGPAGWSTGDLDVDRVRSRVVRQQHQVPVPVGRRLNLQHGATLDR